MAGKSTINVRILGDNKGLENALGDSESKIGAWAVTVGTLAADAIKNVASKAVDVFGEAWGQALAQEDVNAFLKSQLGTTAEDAERLGEVAAGAYRDAWGGSLEETAATVAAVTSSFGDDVSYEWIEEMTGRFTAFGDAFETETADAVNKVGVLLSSGLVDDAEEGLDLLTAALQQVPAALRGEVLDATEEYSQFFNQVGLEGEQALGLLVKGAEDGQYGIDKFGDAIKEFTIRSTDMSDASSEAYDAIGLNAREMTDALLAGGDQAAVAFDQIVGGLLAIEDPADQSAAALALFGTPLEDLGVGQIPDFLTSLGDLENGLGDTEGAAAELADTVGGTTSQKIEAFKRKALGALADFVADYVLPKFEQLVGWFEDNWPEIQKVIGDVVEVVVDIWETKLQPALEAIGGALQSTFEWVIDNKPVLIGVLSAIGVGVLALFTTWAISAGAAAVATLAAIAPFVAIGAAIAAVTAGVVWAYQNWEWFRTAVDAVRAWMVDTLWPAIQDVFGWLRDNVPPILQAVAGFFTGTVLPALQAVWGFIQDYLFPVILAVFGWLRDNVPTIIGAVVTAITTLWGWLQTLWDRSEGLRAFLVSAFKLGLEVVTTAIGVVSTAVSTAIDWLQKIWDKSEGVRGFLVDVFDAAVRTIATAFDLVWGAVEKTVGFFQDVWDKGVEIAGYFEGAFNTAIGVVSTAFDTVGDAVGGVVAAFQTVVGWLETIIEKAQAAIDKIREVLHGEKLDASWITERAEQAGRAVGGPVSAGVPYTVGERGWETFVPRVDGYIVNHRDSVAALDRWASRGQDVPEILTFGTSSRAAPAGTTIGLQVNGDVKLDGITTEAVADRINFALAGAA